MQNDTDCPCHAMLGMSEGGDHCPAQVSHQWLGPPEKNKVAPLLYRFWLAPIGNVVSLWSCTVLKKRLGLKMGLVKLVTEVLKEWRLFHTGESITMTAR